MGLNCCARLASTTAGGAVETMTESGVVGLSQSSGRRADAGLQER